jgi:lysophospholipase L1-like esterase
MRSILDFDAAEPNARGNGVGSPCILVDHHTSRVFVAALWSHGDRGWSGSGQGLQPEQTGQLVLSHSDDDGLTWSRPRSITPQVKKPEWRLCFQGPGCGLQLRDGTLVLPALFREAGGLPRACLLLSADHGETWTSSAPAVPDAPPTSEAQAAELSDGSILLSMRDESRSGQRVWCAFDVRTHSWGQPWSALPDPSTRASLLRTADGSLLFCNPASPRARATLTVRSSKDDGRTWKNGRLIDPRTTNSSCMSLLADGRIAVLYEGEGGLHLARFWPEDANLAAVPQSRQDPLLPPGWWLYRHTQKLKQTKETQPGILFLGDGLTHDWEGAGAKVWKPYYGHRDAANYGYEGDATHHVLWRIQHGELDGLHPKLIVLNVGTANMASGKFTPSQTADGIRAILEALEQKCPSARVLLLALFPQGFRAADELRQNCEEVNALLSPLADGKRVFLLNINHVFLNPGGNLLNDTFSDPLHLTTKGYALWAEAIEPTVQTLLEPTP